MKILVGAILIFQTFNFPVFAQKFATERGEINFISNAELELIRASSTHVRGIIDPSNNQFAVTLEVKSFKGFNSELQREHFLDKYMEIHKYSTATFMGKIIEQIDFTVDGIYEVRAKGTLNIHGQTQIRIIKSRVIVKDNVIKIDSEFIVPLGDHNIEVPSIVNRKIATEIDVTLQATLTAQQ